jgi:hypothetical protein
MHFLRKDFVIFKIKIIRVFIFFFLFRINISDTIDSVSDADHVAESSFCLSYRAVSDYMGAQEQVVSDYMKLHLRLMRD